MTVGERIKTIRTDNELTQKDFANLFGLSHSHISNIENNREKPSDTLLLFMCSKFGLNFEWLKFGKIDNTSTENSSRKKSLDKFYNSVRVFEDKFSELNDDELSKYTNSAFFALSLIFDTYTNRDNEIKQVQEDFLERLWEASLNTSKFNNEDISINENKIELKLLYTEKLYSWLKNLNNCFDKYQSLMFKDTYIEPY